MPRRCEEDPNTEGRSQSLVTVYVPSRALSRLGGSTARWKRCKNKPRTLIGVPQALFGPTPKR